MFQGEGEEHPGRIGQRLPTSVKTAGQAGNHLKVDVATLKQTPDTYKKNVDLLRPLLPNALRRRSADAVAQAFVDHVADNLKWLYHQVPEHIRARSRLWYVGGRAIVDTFAARYGVNDTAAAAVLAALSPQKDWYQNVSLAHRILEIHRGYGENFYRGFVASPEMRAAFDRRPSLAKFTSDMDFISGKSLADIDALERDQDGEALAEEDRLHLKALWTRVYDEAYHSPNHYIISPEGRAGDLVRSANGQPARIGWGSLGEIGKAIRAIEVDGDPAVMERLLGEKHKVRNFYNNLLAPHSQAGDVTIDTHAVAAALLRPLSGNSTEVAHNFENATELEGEPLQQKKRLQAQLKTASGDQANAIKARIKELNALKPPSASGSAVTGVRGTYAFYADAYRKAAAELGVLPRELQSITWEAARGLFEASRKTSLKPEIDAIWKRYTTGKVSLDAARQEVLRAAGAERGIAEPPWAGRSGAGTAADEAAAHSGELRGAGLPGRQDAGGPGTGGGGGTAALGSGGAEAEIGPPRALFQAERTAAPVAHLTGEEIAPADADGKVVRKAARDWYRANLAPTTVTNPELGEIKFTRKGINKAIAASADLLKLRLFPAIPEILKNGYHVDTVPNSDPVNYPTIVQYHWIEANVGIGEEVHRVRVAVEEHTDGKIYYNHNLPDRYARPSGEQQPLLQGTQAGSPSKAGGLRADGVPEASTARSGPASSRPSEPNVSQSADDLNLQILPLDQGQRGGQVKGSFAYVTPEEIARGLRPTVRISAEHGDVSTPAHELGGHQFMFELARDAARDDAPDWLKDDWQYALRWMGADSEDALFERTAAGNFTAAARRFHEKFVRGYEAFRLEGIAPSPALARVFHMFSQFLRDLYHNLAGLERAAGRTIPEGGIKLTDRMREVYGHLFEAPQDLTWIAPERALSKTFERVAGQSVYWATN